ncbi:MAG: hypothetical protein IRZ31_15285 [Thermogemmatispora sp.]|uniref:hypothetical protein n=1 Tax=Thermogemmatispora sp. TaxID=1968838 RepID=UPI00261D5CDC|nr:hypothetical protein [Thermogemmatispora sp.]MBX5458255.1 hypothetical protein [Thermogemmatispora sp.]
MSKTGTTCRSPQETSLPSTQREPQRAANLFPFWLPARCPSDRLPSPRQLAQAIERPAAWLARR